MPRDFHVKRLPKYKPLEAAYKWPRAKHVHHGRIKDSHKGISQLWHLASLSAVAVNQDYLDEICQLKNLTRLSIDMSTATDFGGLANLKNLKFLKIEFSHRSSDFSFVRKLPQLEGLYFEHLKKLSNFDFLEELSSIKRLGIEGAVNGTKQKLESLKPLGTMKGLEEIYLGGATLYDKDLTYLASCPNLALFDCGRLAPKKSFEALRKSMPHLECKYCDEYRHPWER